MDCQELYLEGLYQIYVVQDRDNQRALVNKELDIWIP
jgi:hypothetical protein